MIQQSETIYRRQERMFAAYRNIPSTGIVVQHCGTSLLVCRNVFIPCDDSIALLQNYKIRKDESVLDVGTGSGVLAIFAAKAGARRVVAVDWNKYAVSNVIANVKLHGLETKIDIRLGDMFEAVKKDEKFNVIIANLPFMDRVAQDVIETSIWDTSFSTNRKFFREAKDFLAPHGRIYITQADFGAVREISYLAKKSGFGMKQIGERTVSENGSTFYAFELSIAIHEVNK